MYLGQVKMEISDFCLSLVCYNSTCAYPSVGLCFALCVGQTAVYRPELGTAQEAVPWPELLSAWSPLPGIPTIAQKIAGEMDVNFCETPGQCRLEPGTVQ